MLTLKFAETHNLIAFLDKPKESSGFEEIIDFLNANQIRYALTVNPTIYTFCIEQFWATAKVKTVNGERQLQALVDKKKVIITETSIISDRHLEDDREERGFKKYQGSRGLRKLASVAGVESSNDASLGAQEDDPKTGEGKIVDLDFAKDKGKVIMVEPEVPLNKKDQLALDEEMARNLEAQLQSEIIEEERLARQKEEEANIALLESWDNTQAMMDADF
ncbi:hypothetical protein Tco_1300665 [Tanacetum coccineum]